jgi:hypothetical protein
LILFMKNISMMHPSAAGAHPDTISDMNDSRRNAKTSSRLINNKL